LRFGLFYLLWLGLLLFLFDYFVLFLLVFDFPVFGLVLLLFLFVDDLGLFLDVLEFLLFVRGEVLPLIADDFSDFGNFRLGVRFLDLLVDFLLV